MKRVRPPKLNYKPKSFTPKELRSIELLAKLGATTKQIAEYFRVREDTVHRWKLGHNGFIEAFDRGRLHADMKVANSLFKRAVGMTYIEEEYSAIELDGVPMPMEEMRKVKRTKRYLPPDVKAATTWLKSRQREQWLVTSEHVHKINGNVNHAHKLLQDIPVEELTEGARNMLFEITQKQLANEITPDDTKDIEYETPEEEESN